MVEINGKQCQLARGKENKKEASSKFHRLMLELESNPNVEDAEVTVASLLHENLNCDRHTIITKIDSRRVGMGYVPIRSAWHACADCFRA